MTESDEDWFRAQIAGWAAEHPRTFPWREALEPYAVLVAEMMLRRTRAEQAVPVFRTFLQRFPDAQQLAAAHEDDVAAVLRPLGLHWRVPAFRAMARALQGLGGRVPSDRAQLEQLPGVGDYVAAAVTSLAFDRPAVLVDTNSVRVAARFFGFPYHAESRRNRAVRTQVARLFDPNRPRTSVRALLDFAAVVCRARQPRCDVCPVRARCAWYRGLAGAEAV